MTETLIDAATERGATATAWRGSPTSSRRTTRKPTSKGWWTRRSPRCRISPRPSRSSPSTTAPRDGTAALAERLANEHPDVVRLVRHPINLGYGAALRSGFGAARYELIAFTDGDRQFKVADIGRLTERLGGRRIPRMSSSAFGSSAPIRWSGPSTPGRIGSPTGSSSDFAVTDVDCACKLFRREALDGLRVESGGAFFSAELLIKLEAAGRRGRRGRRAPLPTDGRLGDRRQAAGRVPGGPRLLAASPADVGQREDRPPTRQVDRRSLSGRSK